MSRLHSTCLFLVLASCTLPESTATVKMKQAPPLSDSEQKSRDKTLNHAKKELKKLGKAGLVEIKRMEEEEKVIIFGILRFFRHI